MIAQETEAKEPSGIYMYACSEELTLPVNRASCSGESMAMPILLYKIGLKASS